VVEVIDDAADGRVVPAHQPDRLPVVRGVRPFRDELRAAYSFGHRAQSIGVQVGDRYGFHVGVMNKVEGRAQTHSTRAQYQNFHSIPFK
jgi:hypothetical protein